MSSSTWPRRGPLVGLALLGCAISAYLALYQLRITSGVWDPIFGRGSEAVLTSSFSRALPIPDALLGAAAYGVEAVLGAIGGEERWRERPWLVVTYGVVAGGLVLTALGLIAAQAVLLRTGCTLCLVSAALSLAIGWFARDEVFAAVGQLRGEEA